MRKEAGKVGVVVWLAPLAVLSVCLLLTLFIWNVIRQNATRELQLEFDADVRNVHARVEERLNDYRDILSGVAGLFAASKSVTRREFHVYVERLRLEHAYPGIQGVGFAKLIPASEKQRVTAAIRREGFPQFTIRPEGVRDPYTAIIYLEPFDWRNQRAFGYDMYSEPVRRAAMERARDEDGPVISGKVRLLQETVKEAQSGFLMYLPVYRNNLPHETVSDRRGHLVGWAYEPFRMNDLMSKGVLGRYLEEVRGELEIEIYDGDAQRPEAMMYDSQGAKASSLLDNAQAQFVSSRTTQYFGHNWTIVVHSLPGFEAPINRGRARIAGIGGIVISLLLTWVVWLLSTTNARAVKLAERMSGKLEQTLTQTIAAMATVIEMRDPYTAGHLRRAAELARAIAVEMGLNSEEVRMLYRAALIYEIGKVQVPAEILSKPGRLNDAEFSLIKTHAQAGFNILKGIDFPWPVARIVQQHHERMDGSGYPLGLKGDAILRDARIIGVADVVEAMCSHRPYRPELGVDAALEEIASKRGRLYHPEVVDACIRVFRERGFRLPD